MRHRLVQLRAFTLIELILVMAVIVIATAMITPEYVAFIAGRANANNATLLVSLTNYARTQAIAQGKVYRLNVDPGKETIWLTVGNGGVYTALGGDYGQQFALGPSTATFRTDVVAQQDGQYIEFDSNGRCQPAKFWLTDRYGREIEVACESGTELFRIVPREEMSEK